MSQNKLNRIDVSREQRARVSTRATIVKFKTKEGKTIQVKGIKTQDFKPEVVRGKRSAHTKK